MKNERDNTLDLLKGFAIILVVLGHINVVTPVENFIYSFHMSLFMFISGCTFFYSYSKSTRSFSYILKRFLSLCIPYIFWGWISYYIKHSNNFDFDSFITFPISAEHFNHLWFLPTLFLIIALTIIEDFLTKSIKNTVLRLIVKCVILLFGIFVLFVIFKFTKIKLFRQGGIYFLPFLCGYSIIRYQELGKFVLNPFFLFVCVIFYFIGLKFYSIESSSAISLIARFLLGILICFPFYKFALSFNSLVMTSKKFGGGVQMLSKNTLAIYAIHEFLRPLFNFTFNQIFYDTILKIISALLIIFFCILIKEFLERISFIFVFVLFGKLPKKEKLYAYHSN